MNLPENSVNARLPEPEDNEISLMEIFGVLLDARRVVLGVTGLVLVFAVLYAVFAAPVYTSNALVQVNQGSSGAAAGLQSLTSMLSGTPLPVEAEIQLAKSHTVLAAAVDSVHADIHVRPRHFPLFGGFMARHFDGLNPAPARLGLTSFSWGNDQADVTQFEVPVRLYKKKFRLIVTGPGSFRLDDPSGDSLLVGTVGVPAQADSGRVRILVSALAARTGVRFSVARYEIQETIKDVSDRLSVSELGRQSGVLQFSLQGPDAGAATALLTAIVHADLELNRSLKSEEAASQIDFLQSQLPIMQERVDSARLRLGSYQSRNKVLDLDAESRALLDRLGAIDLAIQNTALQHAQLQQQFGAESPALRAIVAQQDTLNRARERVEQEVARLPAAAQSVLQMQERLQVASGLYTGLLTSIQQLQVVKAGAVGALSVVDMPVEPVKPSGPKRVLIVVIGLLLGLIAGVGVALIRRAFLQQVDDPAVVEARFHLPTLAILPFSREQARREHEFSSADVDREPLISADDPQDPVVEEIRGLRTNLQFVMTDAERPVLCVSGPVSNVGKSFISANLAYLAAEAGLKVVVIDCDLRRGHLNRYFGITRDPGLSQLLVGGASPQDIIRPTGTDGLSIVTTGTYPPNPSELLLRPAFRSFIQYTAQNFDLVVIDAPPVIPVTDGIIVARQASMNIIVTKAGTHTLRELDATLMRYRQNGIIPNGFVMNYVKPRAGAFGYYYGYKYSYRTESKAAR